MKKYSKGFSLTELIILVTGNVILISISIDSKESRIENTFIDIPKGFLHQGHSINENRIIFDNRFIIYKFIYIFAICKKYWSRFKYY